jgi:transcriptional repressor NrdR
LKKLDEIAYVRFASVYRSFRDVDTLADEIAEYKDWRQRDAESKRQMPLSL